MIDGKRVRSTFRDKFFEANWGTGENRRLYDDGKYQRHPDGSYVRITDRQGLGAGTYDVTIGSEIFRCLRVLDVISSPANEGGELIEAFVESGERTVLVRQYLGR